MKSRAKFTSIGGQAVIEGVMMRSPHYVAIALRKPSKRIIIRHDGYQSIVARLTVLKKPILRGVVTLIESMFQGVEALSYSANIAAEAESGKDGQRAEGLSSAAIIGSIAFAFALGMALFVALPHLLTALLTSPRLLGISTQSPLFHLIDGVLKMLILLGYVYAIALMDDIHRVFQYHGAEHRSIHAFEAGDELTVENARKFPNLHPRCGTSFLLFLVLISVGVFSVVFPLFQLTELTSNTVLNHAIMVLIKIVLMLPVAGLAYEFIKMCACRMGNPLFRALIWPGLILQRLTTRDPTDDQLEVALVSLRQVLKLEKNREIEGVSGAALPDDSEGEFEIGALGELGRVQATLAEFPEA